MNAHAFVIDPPAPAPATRTPARAALAAAIRARDAAAERLTTATATAGRAKALLDVVATRIAAIGDIDTEILAHGAETYKTWAAAGGDEPLALGDLPPALVARRTARDAACEEEAAARSAHASLSADRATAAAALTAADAAVHDAAKSVLVEEAGALVAKFDEAKRAALALQDDIAALAMLAVQRGTQSWAESRLALPPAIHAAVTTPMDWRPMLPAAQSYAARRLPAWQALFSALQADPDAER